MESHLPTRLGCNLCAAGRRAQLSDLHDQAVRDEASFADQMRLMADENAALQGKLEATQREVSHSVCSLPIKSEVKWTTLLQVNVTCLSHTLH